MSLGGAVVDADQCAGGELPWKTARGMPASELVSEPVKISDWRRDYNEQRPHSSLGYRTACEFAAWAKKKSCGKDADYVRLENAIGVSHFPTAPATTRVVEILASRVRNLEAGQEGRDTLLY